MELSALRNRAVGAVRNYFNREYDAAVLLNFAGETPIIRRHLILFYSALFFVSMSSALGSDFCYTGNFGRLFAASQAYAMFRDFRCTAPSQKGLRVRLLVYCAYFVWACVTPWFTWFLGVDKGFVVSTMWCASVGFGCFWLVFKQPCSLKIVYFRALLLCCFLIGYGFGFTSSSALMYQPYLWLLWFVVLVHVVAYSQEVVLRARRGDDDHVGHAFHLYTDFPAFVVHVVDYKKKLQNERKLTLYSVSAK